MDVFQISFKAKLWKDNAPGAWHFASMPKSKAKKLRSFHKASEEGWGRMKAQIQVGETSWNTSIWFDTKLDTYLVPINSKVRKKEGIDSGDMVSITINFDYKHWLKNQD